MKAVVPTSALKMGMFVAELDRPWLETPFLLQGFLIDDASQISTLQECCRSVTIDRSRSLGDHFAVRPEARGLPRKGGIIAYREVDEAGPEDFVAICRQLRQEQESRRYARPPAVDGEGRSRLEPELLYSAPIVEDARRTLKSIRESLGAGRDASCRHIACLVKEMTLSVERNPDAMLWLARLKSADQYSYDHAIDVSVHLMVLGRFLALPAKTVEQLGLAGLLQDVGKVDIPEEVLSKAGDLSEAEYALVQSHVASSLEILVGKPDVGMDILDIVANHHERADGSGYPRRLKGERISLAAELAGLVDSYCAMTRDRAYDKAISSQKALEALIGQRGTKFRAAVVDQLIQCLGLYPIGSLVELNSGEVGIVIQQNQVRRLKPRLLVVLAPDKSLEPRPRTLDLLMDPLTPTGYPYRILQALPANAYGIDPGELYLR